MGGFHNVTDLCSSEFNFKSKCHFLFSYYSCYGNRFHKCDRLFFIFKGPIIFVILQAFINISHVQNVRCLLITNFNLVNVIILQHGLMYLYGFIIIVTCERIYSGSCTIILNSKQMVLKLSHFKCGNKLCYKNLLFILLIATSTLEL